MDGDQQEKRLNSEVDDQQEPYTGGSPGRSRLYWRDLLELAHSIPADERQRIIDETFKVIAVLTSKMRSLQSSTQRRSVKRLTRVPDLVLPSNATWRESGDRLRQHWLARADQLCDCWWCTVYRHTDRGRRERDWVLRVTWAIFGDASELVEYLQSRRKLNRFDRIVLADLLKIAFEGEVKSELHPRGRPKEYATSSCAIAALKFYGDWKTLNRRLGICDWGHSDEMKDQACWVAIEHHKVRIHVGGRIMSDHPMYIVPSFDEVRELIERPRARLRG